MMTPYIPTRRTPTFLQREATAKQREADRLDRWNDTEQVCIRRIRAAQLALSEIGAEGDRQWHRENDAVPLPRAIAGHIHPSRAHALEAFTASWSDDPKEPITPMRTLAELIDALAVDARAEVAAANADYEAILAEKRRNTFEEAGTPDPALSAISSEATLNAALDREGVLDGLDLVVDDEAHVLPVRRGPGRPRRVDHF